MRRPSVPVFGLWAHWVVWALWAFLPARPVQGADVPGLQARESLRVLAVLSPEESYFVAPDAEPLPGFDVEVLEGFARLHKLKVEVVSVPSWDALIPSLRRKEGDLIAGGFTATDSRRKQIDFTVEVFPSRSVVITRKPQAQVETIEDLKSRKVGTIKGTFMEEELAAVGIVNVDKSIPTGGLPDALRSGRIDAAADGIEAALTAKAKDPDLQLGVFLGDPTSLAYGVRKDDAALRQALDAYIANLRRTSTWSRLVVKYFGSAAPEILKKARAQ
jgi:lysine/arginine/ornithine transport system substrate-binding protein